MRLDQYLSNLKFGSRKEIKAFLKSHDVRLDGILVTKSDIKIEPQASVLTIDGMEVPYLGAVNLCVYKPQGYLSANHDPIHPVVTDLIKEPYDRLTFYLAGRLDLDTEGLLILTTEGIFAHEITHPKKHIDKTYEAVLDKPFGDEKRLLSGVTIKDGKNQDYFTKPKSLQFHENHVKIVIDEGKFHQVKRMFEAVGYHVVALKLVGIGNLTLKDLKAGEYYPFRKEDL